MREKHLQNLFIKIISLTLTFCMLTSLTTFAAKDKGLRNLHTHKKTTVAVGLRGVYLINKNKTFKLTKDTPSKKILYANKRFLTIDYMGSLFSSKNGNKWTKHTPPKGSSFSAITYFKGKYVIADNLNVIYTSKDLKNWTQIYTSFASDYAGYVITEFAVFKGRLFAIFDNFAFSSPIASTTNLTNWKTIAARRTTRYNNYKVIGNTLYILGVRQNKWIGDISKITIKKGKIKTTTVKMKKGQNAQDIIKHNKKLLILSNNLKDGFATQYNIHRLVGKKTKLIKKTSSSDGGSRFYLNKKLYVVGYNNIKEL